MPQILTEADIENLVEFFYASVRKDNLLGPIFDTKIAEELWPAHLVHITNFWSSIFLKTKRFTGNPMQKHLSLSGLTPSHFDRWLLLFRKSADSTLREEQADQVHSMAIRIAQSLQMGLAINHEKSGLHGSPFSDFGLQSKKPL